MALRSFLFSIAEPLANLLSNCILAVSERLRLVFLRRGKVSAVRTRVALNEMSGHVLLRGVRVFQLTHGCILPRILARVHEEDVVAFDVEAAVVLVGLVRSGLDLTTEDSLAEFRPVV